MFYLIIEHFPYLVVPQGKAQFHFQTATFKMVR